MNLKVNASINSLAVLAEKRRINTLLTEIRQGLAMRLRVRLIRYFHGQVVVGGRFKQQKCPKHAQKE